MKIRIIIITSLILLFILIVVAWVNVPPKVSNESMGRPYVLEEMDNQAVIMLDEADWEYRDKVEFYQYSYRLEGGKWQTEPPERTKGYILTGVSPMEVYEVKVIGLDGHKRKIGESDTVTIIIDEEWE